MKHLFKTSILRFVKIALVAAFIVVFMMPYTKAQATTVRLNASKKTLYYRSAGENIPDGKSAKEDKGFAQSYTLKLSGVDKSAAITWKSSNSKIAKVSSKGKVTAVSEGTATITASCGGKSYKCKVTVSKAGFSTGTETELTVGDKVKLKIKGDTVQKFKSSKRSVAKVTSAGNLTAKKAGKAVITAVCENGTYELTINVAASEKVAEVTPGPTSELQPGDYDGVSPVKAEDAWLIEARSDIKMSDAETVENYLYSHGWSVSKWPGTAVMKYTITKGKTSLNLSIGNKSTIVLMLDGTFVYFPITLDNLYTILNNF